MIVSHGTSGNGPAVASPIATTFDHEPDRVLMVHRGVHWTTGRLLSYATDVARAVPSHARGAVAVRVDHPAFLFASLLGLWKSGRYPILLDPEQTGDRAIAELIAEVGSLLVASDPSGDSREVLVEETRSERLVPEYPLGEQPEVGFLTSGSTGTPKAIVKKARQLARQFAVEPQWLGLPPAPSVVCLVPGHHILGYIYGFYLPSGCGGDAVFLRGVPSAWVEEIRTRKPALVVGVPAQFRLMLSVLEGPLPRAVYLSSGGPLASSTGTEFARKAGSPIVQIYGSTETGGIAGRVGDGPWDPIPGLTWDVRPDDGRLRVRAAWQEDPGAWHVTDDVAEAEGEAIRLVGRADSVVKVGGRRFSTAEIAGAVLQLPGVDDAHAVAYDRRGETAVALFVTTRRVDPPTSGDVRAYLADRLARFKLPRKIRIVAELPRRGVGKVDAEALRAIVASDPEGDDGRTATPDD